MERSERIKRFRSLGLGMFVHFGVYSVMGRGEWIKFCGKIPDEIYDPLKNKFCPKKDWADKLCSFAKRNGFKYIVLTTRHHDGYSLYDTCGLNDYDAVHTAPGRDLVREFTDACRKKGIVPFFYHTLIDWREEQNYASFKDYLVYLRKSVEIICKNYGEIGGFWFDGQWKYPDADWEWDKLVSLIRQYQPNAMVINNSGLDNLGGVIDNLFDSLTFERSNVSSYDYFKSGNELAVEMCQTLNSYWGYAEGDFSYKSTEELIRNLCICRKNGGNFLLNIGPLPDGSIRPIDRELVSTVGRWININKKALYQPRPCKLNMPENTFALRLGKKVYAFIEDDPDKVKNEIVLPLKSVKEAVWLDNNEPVSLEKTDGGYKITSKIFNYGFCRIYRVMQITL